ncbi:hypothetical protein [Levilactobacillus wangkuiensis]|uniref:hypothetical protein n=1 Tax=Levilactobacillus wangkuiensis TaxID=2799566 RepID=UPI00194577B2|nr:hypothetical protein [Levilactobacillus wangkuiensis]
MSHKLPVLAITLATLGVTGLSMMQSSVQANASSFNDVRKGNSTYTTFYSELAKNGFATRHSRHIDFAKAPDPYFNPVWKKGKTKAYKVRGTTMSTYYDGGPGFSANGNQGTFYRLSSNPAIRYTYVGTFRGKKVDMIIQMGGYKGEPLKKTVGGTHVSYKNQAIVFMTNKFGIATPKSRNTQGKAYRNGKIYKNISMNDSASHADITIRIVNHGTNTNVKADADHTIGLGFMEMEPAYLKAAGGRHYTLGQRVMTYSNPTEVGNYTTKAGKSNIDREFGEFGVLKLKDDTHFPENYFNHDYTDFDGPKTRNSALAVYKTSEIGVSWRGHAPWTDLLDISGMKLPQKKAPKQPAPKKYVGPQSSNPKTYKATSSALADYTKSFSWRIVQKTKAAKFSGKGYTITDTLPGGTTISSATAPSGWSKSVSGNKITFKATKNVYKKSNAKTYSFIVTTTTTKSQAMHHTSFNNHVTSRRKISKSKWQTKNSNTAKWTLKNEEIKGYFIDFDHHDYAVAKGYDIFTPKQIYNSGVTSGQKTIVPKAEVVAPDNGKLYKLVHGPKDGTYATPSEMKWTSARIKIVNNYSTGVRTIGYTKKGKPITETYRYVSSQSFPNGNDKQIHYWYYRTKWYHQVGHAKQGTDPNPYTDSTDPDGDLIKADGNQGEFY